MNELDLNTKNITQGGAVFVNDLIAKIDILIHKEATQNNANSAAYALNFVKSIILTEPTIIMDS